MTKRSIIISIIVVIILLFMAKSAFIKYKIAQMRTLPAATVEVATAKQDMWKEQITATGTISAINGVVIKPEVAGTITKIYFKSGSDVKKGDPLFQIYPDVLKAQLQSAEAQLQLAQVEYQRELELYQKKVEPEQSLDEKDADLKAAQASVAQIKAQLVQNNIVAPFSGRIGLKEVDIGDYVTIGESLVPLQQMDPLRVQFNVPDRYLKEVKVGDTVDVTPSSAPDTIYQGQVYALNSAVYPDTRMFSMWAKIPNPNETLIPGTYAKITLYSGQAKPVIVIPQTAVLYSPQGEYVYTVVDKIAKKVEVTPGLRQGNMIAITDGLKVGDVVVTAGQVKLFDNTPVQISKDATYGKEQAQQDNVVTFSDDKAAQHEVYDEVSQPDVKQTDTPSADTQEATPATDVAPSNSSTAN